MKGKILDFNLQAGEGIISGEDGSRYNFVSAEWKSADSHPASGMSVDFDVNENNAVGIYVDVAKATQSDNADANTGTAKLIYYGYLAGLIIPFVGFIGLIMAYVNKGNGPHWLDENYRFQIRTYWIFVLYMFISIILMFVLIGYITALVSLVWFIIRCVKGLKAINNKQVPQNINGWLF